MRNNEITIKLLIADIFGCRDTAEVRNDVMNCSAKFEKFLPHSIITPSFTSVGSQMPELDQGGGGVICPPYRIGSQNTAYKLGLNVHTVITGSLQYLDVLDHHRQGYK